MKTKLKSSALLALSIEVAFGCASALANPSGAQIAAGSVSIATPSPGTLAISNSPGAIINWQSFSIGAGETTRFIQQSASSTVLNRVVSNNLSQIYGTLQSNGRVFLINPNGIIFGASAVIDTAGFLASTLNISDAEFIANRLRFMAGPEPGPISNHGLIRARGDGSVVLIAPNIENTGIIQAEDGQLILAAGRSVSLTSLDQAGVEFEIQAPSDSVLNLGKLIAERGTVQVFASQLKHSGEIRAGAMTRDGNGDIVLAARDSLVVGAGSITRADGASGGRILLQSGVGTTEIGGEVTARGASGQGGDIRALGRKVNLVGQASLDASGASDGGTILVGGDFQGGNTAVQNASDTFVGSRVSIRADAGQSGDGGKVVIWSDDTTHYFGSISARGGALMGDGGNVEVSGKQNLNYRGGVDVGALNGAVGRLLLDPLILYIRTGGGSLLAAVDQASDIPDSVASIDPAALAAANASVTLMSGGDMHFVDPVTLTAAGAGLTAVAGGALNVNANITLNNGNLSLTSGTGTLFLSFGKQLVTGGGSVTLNSSNASLSASSSTLINSGGGAVQLNAASGAVSLSGTTISAGSGNLDASANSSVSLGTVTAGNLTATSVNSSLSLSTGNIAGAVNLASRFGLSFNSITSGSLTATSSQSSISGSSASTGTGNISLTGQNGVFTGTLDTTGIVTLAAPGGSISTSVSNAGSLSLNAGSSISASTSGVGALAASSSASSFGNVTVSSTGNLTFSNIVGGGSNSTVSLTSSGGSIVGTGSRAISGSTVNLSASNALGSAALPLNTTASALALSAGTTFNVANTGALQALSLTLSAQNMGASSAVTATGLTLNLSSNGSDATLTSFANATSMSGNFRLDVSDGGLTVTTAGMIAGSTGAIDINAQNNMTVAQIAQGGSGTVNIESRNGSLTIGDGASGVTATGAITANALGNIVLNSATGTALMGGGVTVTSQTGNVGAGLNNVAFEVNGLTGPVNITGASIGDNTTPFHINGSSINLVATGTGGVIGGPAANVLAQAPIVSIDGQSTFNVTTGTTNVSSLSIVASALGMGAATSSLISNGTTYNFVSNGTNFTDINSGVMSIFTSAAGQMGGGLNFRAKDGNIVAGDFDTTATNGRLTFGADAGSLNMGNINTGNGNLDVSVSNSGGTVTMGDLSLGTGTLRINYAAFGGNLGAVATADITANTISINDSGSASYGSVSLGALTAPVISVNNGSFAIYGDASTSSISTTTLDINTGTGSSFGSLATGSIIKTGVSGFFGLGAGTGLYQFTQIDAGTGSVTIKSAAGIEQTGGPGINSTTVSLQSTSGPISATASAPLLITGTKNLTVDAGGLVNIQNNDDFATLNLTVRNTAAAFTLAGMPNQTVTVTPDALGVDVLATNGAAAAGLNFAFNNADSTVGKGAIDDITIDTQGSAPSGGPISLTAAETLGNTLASFNSGGSSLSLAGAKGVQVQNITGTGTTTLTSSAGAIAYNSITTANGFVTLDGATGVSGGAIDSGSNGITINGRAGAVSGSTITTTGFGSVNVSTNSSGGGAVSYSGAISTGGGLVSLSGGAGINYSTVNAGSGSITLFGNSGNVTGGALTSTNGNLNVSSGLGTVTLSGGATTAGTRSITLTSFGNLGFTTLATGTGSVGLVSSTGAISGSTVTTTGTVTLNASNGSVGSSMTPIAIVGAGSHTLNLSVGGLFFLTDANNLNGLGITLTQGSPAGAFMLTAPNLVGFGLSRDSSGNVQLTGASGTVSNPLNSFSLSSNTGDLTVTGNITNVGSISLNAGRFNSTGGSLIIGTASPTTIQGTGSLTLRARQNMTLQGGSGTGDAVTVSSTGSSIFMDALGNISANGGSGSGASVLVSGFNGLTVSASGNLSLVSGNGSGASVIFEKTGATGSQSIQSSALLSLLGQAGDVRIRTAGGSQFISGSNISLGTAAGAAAGSTVAIENNGGGSQSISANGALSVSNGHSPASVLINSAGTQSISAGYVSVATLAGSSSSSVAGITATGNQSFSLFGPVDGQIMAVKGLGAGTAKVTSGATQTITASNFFLASELAVGDTTALGKSLISATDQNFVVGSMKVVGGAGIDATSKVTATNKQAISLLAGSLSVLGGSGMGAFASIDPLTQSIFVLSDLLIQGGSGDQAYASIESTTTTSLAANTIANVRGAGAGADAFISTNTLNIVATTCEACDLLATNPLTNPARDRGSFATVLNITASLLPARQDIYDLRDSPLDPTAVLLALQDRSDKVLDDSGPEDEKKDKKKRRAEQCR